VLKLQRPTWPVNWYCGNAGRLGCGWLDSATSISFSAVKLSPFNQGLTLVHFLSLT